MALEPELIDGVPAFTVSTFNGALKAALKQLFPQGVWIEGEIEGMKPQPHATGHYFSLIEGEGRDKVKIDVKLFSNSGDLSRVTAKMRTNGIEMKNGIRVRFLCTVDFYAQRGEVSLIIKDVDTQFTVGDIAAKRAELIARLQADGTFAENKRRQVARVPLRLGIVSSSQAAGYIDALTHLQESGIGFDVRLCDVNVMGDHAVGQIVGAIDTFSRRDDIDLVLVMRGGGSKSDLATFDAEAIARAIARCPHPVFTGIGHEIDTSVADMAAHTHCKTPTACADEVIAIVGEFLGDLADAAVLLRSRTHAALARSRGRLSLCADRLRTRPRAGLDRATQRLLAHANAVRLLDPATSLARGWSITRHEDGRIVRSVADVAAGEDIVTLVVDGSIASTVKDTKGAR